MSDLVIQAASYLGPEGHGNDRTGLRPWPATCADGLRQGELRPLHWSLVFDSDPSRFARMDLMCRLGLMAVELLEAGLDTLPPTQRERLGVGVETCFGALATDVQFLRTPRPTLFTYSLPSTVLGEICIRHRLQGPGLCLVSAAADGRAILDETREWLRCGVTDTCLCLGIEAVDRDLVTAGLLPHGLPLDHWHACAALLGHRSGGQREHPLETASLLAQCQRRCGLFGP